LLLLSLWLFLSGLKVLEMLGSITYKQR